MKYLSEKLTQYVIDTGTVAEEFYAVYQYGFQIGLEMFSCFIVCFGIAIYLHMIPEFFISTSIFILLRSYAGGVHLNSFSACFICSVFVQTGILYFSGKYHFNMWSAWIIIVIGSLLIWNFAPVDNINHRLDANEKKHCKRVTTKIFVIIFLITVYCTFADINDFVSLNALTVLVVLVSQCIGMIVNSIGKKEN